MQNFPLLLIISAFASEENTTQNEILVKIEEDEYIKTNSKKYVGVTYHKRDSTWRAQRRSKKENKTIYNGNNYKDEETAAHASDTLARKLIANGEKGHKLNFPDDDTNIYPEKTSNYIGLTYIKKQARWRAERRSKKKRSLLYNGKYNDEKTAALASDTLARKLIANGEKHHKLNFPDDDTEVYPNKTSNYFGVHYNEKLAKWHASRWSKNESKTVHNKTYQDEETAARASDSLARKLIANDEKGHKLNFPNVNTEVYAKEYQNNKRKRPASFKCSKKCGRLLDKFGSKEYGNNL